LDGLFKFWIFQYLRQSSPSTAAIFNEMNQWAQIGRRQ
jgi:hypothetical protein